MVFAVSENVQIAIIAGLLSGGFALLGSLVGELVAGRRAAGRFRAETALELAADERLIWDPEWLPLHTRLQQQQTRLAVAGAPETLAHALYDMSQLCWADYVEDVQAGDEYVGIDRRYLDARAKVLDALGAHLLRRGTRSSRAALEREAVDGAKSLLNDPDNGRLVVGRRWRLVEAPTQDIPP